MITSANFKDLLLKQGFTETSNNLFSKEFPEINAYLRVDFNKQELIYPEDNGLKINERQTCNFKAKENFVVFECVYRLLEKGYKPQHIELEPRWQVGHGASGGRADILIRDNDGKTLLIIECKTWGTEFDNAWKDTLNGKGQLFTYAHQERSTQYLCLYASGLEDNTLKYASQIIAVRDNEDILKRQAVENPLTYREADSARELYKTWHTTYKSDYATRGIFEPDIQPYQIGKAKYNVTDLQIVTEADIQPKYHEFATILRQHNVSGRENAFDKLVNLFLCKIVDEKHNQTDLQFYWRGVAFDDYFGLIDRLQRLYRNGMREFLKEAVTYIDNQTIYDAFKFFKNDPDATRDKILSYFRDQKYFTNNDFSFLDVHNEQLFYQNAEILLKIVRLLQDIRLNGNQQNQFLGDMFEFFLDQGFKQSEGQFFTPLPITRFIIQSLPLEKIFSDGQNPPKVIDYACGAGHFLTEMAMQLRGLELPAGANIRDFYRHFYGIEKEYRLSKVAKVSAFMYNQDEINIIYGDALAKHKDTPEGKFALLVSNPPYSVKGFLETLAEAERGRYTLGTNVDPKNYPTNNSIEAFFVERAWQLLAPHGAAGIVTPSSILSNASGVYTGVREILLQQFDIVALVELGSGTFGKTGTNTVTLFLRRKDDNPPPADHYHNRVQAWFNGDNRKDGLFADVHLLQAYCAHIGLPWADYQTLLNGRPNQAVLEAELFQEYRRAFDKSSQGQARQKQKAFQQKNPAEQETELNQQFVTYIRTIEQEKVAYFVLAYTQPNPVLVVRSPQGTDEMKKFLGYEWSAAKGQEGIKYLRGSSIDRIETPLFDPQNRHHPEKISTLIRQNYEGPAADVPPTLQPYVTLTRLVDLLDFGRVSFDKQISLAPKYSRKSKWVKQKLEELLVELKGTATKVRTNEYLNEGDIPVISQDSSSVISGYVMKDQYQPITDVPLVVFGDHTCVFKYIDYPFVRGADGVVLLKPGKKLLPKYFFYFLLAIQNEIIDRDKYQRHYKHLKNIEVPIPLPEVQAQIVAECQAIDNEVEQAEQVIINAKIEIENKLNEFLGQYPQRKISDVTIINPSKTEIKHLPEDTLVSFIEMASVSNDGFVLEMINKSLKELKKGSYTYFAENDIIVAKITPCMENGKCALVIGLTNGIGMGSSEFHVLRTKDEISSEFLFLMINREVVRKEAEKHFTGSSGHRRVPASFYENYQIPVPTSLDVQEVLVKEVKTFENQIITAREIIASAPGRRQAVLQKYL